MPLSFLNYHKLTVASNGLWASSRSKNSWIVHTWRTGKCMKDAYMWIFNRLKSSHFLGMHDNVCLDVLLGLQSTNQHRLCEHGISSNHKLCKLNPKQTTQSLSIYSTFS